MPMHMWGLTAGEMLLADAKNKSYILLRNIDLTGIKSLTYEYSAEKRSGEIVVRIESLGGPVISKVAFTPTGRRGQSSNPNCQNRQTSIRKTSCIYNIPKSRKDHG